MITMPISDYPTSSDPVCRNQALSERKGEINSRMQDVEESNLPQFEKDRINDHLESEKTDINTKIRHNLSEESYNKKLENKRIDKKIMSQKELLRQDGETHHIDRKV